jgi:hypothetical protein
LSATSATPNASIVGDVYVDNRANITAAGGSGIYAFNYGMGNVSVTSESGASITATAAGPSYGIFAFNYGKGNSTVTTAFGTTINSGSTGINAGNQATPATTGSGSSVTVIASGLINSGANNNNSGTAPAGILAGYNPSGSSTFSPNVFGDVLVSVWGDGANNGKIVAAAGDGINAYNNAVGNTTVNLGSGVTIQALTSASPTSGNSVAPYGVAATNSGSGDIIVTMSNGDSITSGSNGINAINSATSILASAGSIIAVTTAGSIQTGTVLTNNGSSPSGIAAGYLPGGNSAANLNVNGSVIVNNAANVTTDASSSGSIGINAFNWGNGNVTVNDASGTTILGTQYGIEASAQANGTGNVAINVYANATVNSRNSYGIFAFSKDAGNISVITSSGDVINAGGVGINAASEATAISSTLNSSIVVTAAGTINSGPALTGFNNSPGGIVAGYIGATSDPALNVNNPNAANSSVFGETVVNNSANINAAAGDGIRAYSYGIGNVTINDFAGTITALGAANNPPSGAGIGLLAVNYGSGGATVSTLAGTVINAGSSGIAALNKSTAIDTTNNAYVVPSTAEVSVLAFGTIRSGTIPTATAGADPAAGILAGFNPNNTNTPNNSIHGNVAVDNYASILNTEIFNVALSPSVIAGDVIELLLAGAPLAHPVTHVVTQADVSAAAVNLSVVPSDLGSSGASALSAEFLDPSQNVVGTVTPTLVGSAQTDGIRAINYGTGNISIINEAGAEVTAIRYGLAALGFDGGNVAITNSGSVTAGVAVDATTTGTGTASIDNSGYLGGNAIAYNATFTNELGADWSINGASVFSGASSLSNLGTIESNGTSSMTGLAGLMNSGTLAVESGSLKISAPVTGGGVVMIFGATMEFAGASDAQVQFDTGPANPGKLLLDDVAHFTGSVAGFTFGDTIDLVGISPANVSVSNAGALQINYGTGSFALLGNYSPTGFSISTDGNNGTDIVWNHQTPVILTNQFSLVHNPDGTTTIAGLQLTDSDPGASNETFTLTASTQDAAFGTNVTPSASSGSLTALNTSLSAGVIYNPGSTPPLTDKVTLTVADSFGAKDTVNFVFNASGTGSNATLQGTPGNDVILATGNSDTLSGSGGQDQFVFAPNTSGPAVQHAITDFTEGIDQIDVRQFSNLSSSSLPSVVQVGNDTLITLDGHDNLLLRNFVAASLHAGDFIVHA